MPTVLEKLQRAIAIHGFVGTAALCMDSIFGRFTWLTPAPPAKQEVCKKKDLEFDQKWGVDTGGDFVPEKAQVLGSNWKYGIKYQGCDATFLHEVLTSLAVEYKDYTFVDLGCGKGRAILVAGSFPFRQVIGVEYSAPLCETARDNVARFPHAERACADIEIICADASSFTIPDGPLIIFLFNPFGRQVMQPVVQNVLASYRQNPRRIIVVYFTPLFADLWKSAGFMGEIQRSKFIAIYDTQARGA